MPASPAELASLAAQIEEITRRITALAESASSSHEADLAADLYGIERTLVGSRRRIEKLVQPPRRR